MNQSKIKAKFLKTLSALGLANIAFDRHEDRVDVYVFIPEGEGGPDDELSFSYSREE